MYLWVNVFNFSLVTNLFSILFENDFHWVSCSLQTDLEPSMGVHWFHCSHKFCSTSIGNPEERRSELQRFPLENITYHKHVDAWLYFTIDTYFQLHIKSGWQSRRIACSTNQTGNPPAHTMVRHSSTPEHKCFLKPKKNLLLIIT